MRASKTGANGKIKKLRSVQIKTTTQKEFYKEPVGPTSKIIWDQKAYAEHIKSMWRMSS